MVEYVREDGSNPFRTWFERLHAQAAAKVAIAARRLEAGNFERDVDRHCRRESHRLGPGYRIYLARDGDTLIILPGGGTKQRQRRDIYRAAALRAEYKARKAAAAKAKGRR